MSRDADGDNSKSRYPFRGTLCTRHCGQPSKSSWGQPNLGTEALEKQTGQWRQPGFQTPAPGCKAKALVPGAWQAPPHLGRGKVSEGGPAAFQNLPQISSMLGLQTAQRIQISACNKEGIKPMLSYLFENTDSFRNQMNVMKPSQKTSPTENSIPSGDSETPPNPSRDFRFIVCL